MITHIKYFFEKFLKYAPAICFVLIFYAVFISMNIVKIRQNILLLSKEIIFIEKNCKCLANKNTEMKLTILIMQGAKSINQYNNYSFEPPQSHQIFKASKTDILNFAHNGATKHFAIKQKSSDKLAFVKK